MADERIDIIIRDRVSASISRKIVRIGTDALKTHKSVEQLKRALNFQQVRINSTALANLDRQLRNTLNLTNRLAAAQGNLQGALSQSNTAQNQAGRAANNAAVAQERLRTAQNKTKKTAAEAATAQLRLANAERRAAQQAASLAAQQSKAASSSNRLVTAVTRVGGALRTVGTRALVASRSMLKFTNSVRRLRSASVSSAQSIRSFLSAFLLIGATGGIFRQLDAYRSLQNQLRVTTDSQRGLNEITKELFAISNRARVPVDSLAKTFRRFDFALKEIGGSQRESLRLTETVAKLLTLSGSTAEEAASSLLQLSQAFNKGKLDGDEFRSVAELMPQAIDAISKELGIARKDIFKFSKEGKITTEVLRNAFARLANQVDKDMTKIPRTIGQAWTQLINTVTRFFGQLNEKFGFTDQIIKALDLMRDNLPTVTRWLKAFGAALVVIGGSGIMALLYPLGLFFASAPGQIALAAGYLAFFSSEIKVLKNEFGGLLNLRDLFVGLLKAIPKLLADLTAGPRGLIADIFGDPQQVFNFILGALERLKDGIITVGAFFRAAYETWKSLSWGDIGNLVLEGFINAFRSISTLFLQVLKSMIPPIVGLWDDLQKFIINSIADIADRLPFVLQTVLGIDGATIQSIRDAADAYRTDVTPAVALLDSAIAAVNAQADAMTPTVRRAADTFGAAWTNNIASMQETFDRFSKRVIDGALENARSRIRINGTAWERIKLAVFDAGVQITRNWQTVMLNAVQNQAAATVGMRQDWSATWQAFQSIAQTVAQAVLQILQQIGSQISGLASKLASLAGSASGGIANVLGRVSDSNPGAAGQLGGLLLGGSVGGQVGGVLGPLLGVSQSSGLRPAQEIQETANELSNLGGVMNAVEQSWDSFQSGIEDTTGAMQSAAST